MRAHETLASEARLDYRAIEPRRSGDLRRSVQCTSRIMPLLKLYPRIGVYSRDIRIIPVARRFLPRTAAYCSLRRHFPADTCMCKQPGGFPKQDG